MQAVVSILDTVTHMLLTKTCAQLKEEFCACGFYVTEYPHFSYQVAEGFDLDALKSRLAEEAARLAPFTTRVSGVGIFPGPHPVIFLPVVRTLELSHLHHRLWEVTNGAVHQRVGHYHAMRWIPHITLAQKDVTPDTLPGVMRWLNDQTFDWEIRVDNLALIYTDGETDTGMAFRFDLTGEERIA
ncbi:MAG: hypothetical protein GVY30_12765 [Chloroflexi bacterium]|jgi:2'-5' RNA ligase|nr:hypothetical protein [Chloroflexota bacterium]